MVTLLSPSQHKLDVAWPPRKSMTPGTVHHYAACDRLDGYLVERGCRELIGCRGAAPPGKHRQRFSLEPEMGLVLLIRCPVLTLTSTLSTRARRQSEKSPCLQHFTHLPDNDYGHGVLTLHVVAHLLAQRLPDTRSLPLYLYAEQDYRLGYAPQQSRRIERDDSLAPAFLTHLRDAYRYDLTTKPVATESCDHRPEAAAQVVWATHSPAGVPVQARTSPPPPLFDTTK